MNPLKKIISPMKKLGEGLSMKAKLIIAVLIMIMLLGAAFVGYQVFDYTQNDPKFCVSCHLMSDAYAKWESSVHKGINCHDCHHLSVAEMNQLMYSFVFHRPEVLPDRHGKVIVPWKYCVKCHWEDNEKFPQAPKINESKIHAKHYFTEQIECSKCHGYKAHMFRPEPRFCVMCHEGKEVHSKGMQELNCLNCHTDTKSDLKPDRDKCLFCHGSNKDREDLLAEGRLDVEFCAQPQGLETSKLKINTTKDSPMQFECYTCHHPHDLARPDWKNCTECHKNIKNVGKHEVHIDTMSMSCKDCHKPHTWSVTKEQAKKECASCHAYKSPEQFIKK